jgi:nucleotide-binding universal stress UspA family protein
MRLLTLKTVLVAADLNDSSRPVLQTAAHLAQLAGARLHLLHVASGDLEGGEDWLLEYFRLVAPAGMQPDSVQGAFGYPAAVIVAHAVRLGADVIVVGPHRRHKVEGPLGSTAASVVRTAHCPCLVAATELRLPLQRVVAAIDVSAETSEVLPLALAWASALRPRGEDASLVALHASRDQATDKARLLLQGEIARTMERSHAAARVTVTEQVVPGSDPAEAVLREVASMAADLLVMGTRDTGDTTSELGSVSAAVARATPCPLLLVPPALRPIPS